MGSVTAKRRETGERHSHRSRRRFEMRRSSSSASWGVIAADGPGRVRLAPYVATGRQSVARFDGSMTVAAITDTRLLECPFLSSNGREGGKS